MQAQIHPLTGILVHQNGSLISAQGNPIKPSVNPDGYLYFFSKGKTYKVHRIVATVWIPNTGNLPEVNHKDGNKQNNHKDNLEWVTHHQNIIHALENGIHATPERPVLQLKDGSIIGSFRSISEGARFNGFAKGDIWRVLNGRRYTCGGYEWEYASETT